MGLFINQQKLTDLELVRRYQDKSDSESLGVLYNRYLHLVYGLCLKYLQSREESQDAVMDIYEVLADKLKSHEVKYFKSWLYMVSKNHCLMVLRASQRFHLVEDFVELEELMHPNEEEHIVSDLDALEACMKGLKSDQQNSVRLFYLERKSYQEIAIAINKNLKEVKSYIQNGKRNLKICLEGKHVRRQG